MATPKFSNEDIEFVGRALQTEVYYAHRDAAQTHIGNQPKNRNKMRFDIDRAHRIDIIAAFFKAATGFDPFVQRTNTGYEDFMKRMGCVPTATEVNVNVTVNDSDVPF